MFKKITQRQNHTYFLRNNELPIIEEEQRQEEIMTSTGQSSGTAQNNSFDIFNALKLPDAIKDLPKYDGNPRLLFEFINNVEEILSVAQQTDNTPQGRIFLRAIRNKIEGSANEVLNMYGTQLNWDEIKANLILHYSDKRTETSLIRDLHRLQQNKNSVEEFYSEIIEIQSSLMNNVGIHETDKNVISSKKDLFSEMCLNAFLSGLAEPLGANIRAARPKSLAEAFSFCIKEQNIFYSRYIPYSKRQKFGSSQQRQSFQNNQNSQNPQSSPSPQNRNFSSYRSNNQSNSRENPPQTNQQTAQTPQNKNFFKQEANSSQTKRTYQSQNFKDNNSRYSNFNKNYNGNQSSKSTFTNKNHEESNNVNVFRANSPNSDFQSFDDYQDTSYDRTEELANIEEPQNFRIYASNNQQVI